LINMYTMNIDIETYSDQDLRKVGVYKYVDSKAFEILLLAFKVTDTDVVTVYDIANGDVVSEQFLSALTNPNIVKKAWNATFERVCLDKFFGIKSSNWQCTQLRAMVLGLPAALGKCAIVLELEQKKMKTTGITWFSKPEPKSGEPRERTGERWEEFKKYCAQDVRTEATIDSQLPRIPIEWSLYGHNSEVNDLGIKVDVDLVNEAVELDNKFKAQNLEVLKSLTGLENPNSDSQMKTWLNDNGLKNERGEDIESLVAEDVEIYLDHLKSGRNALEELKPTNELLAKVLELRKLVKKTSTAKYTKILKILCQDGRIHGLLQFYGAGSTGRWAGRLVQTQNLYRPGVDGDELTELRSMIKNGVDPRPKFGFDAIAQAIRTSFIAENGLTAIDFSAIEARVLSWLAGEDWRNEIFASHGKIYEAAAAKLFDIDIDEVTKDQRKKGKVAELALGYQGGLGALRRMGAEGTDDELEEMKYQWRKACPKIVSLWYGVQDAVRNVLTYGMRAVTIGDYLRIGSMRHEDMSWLVIQLPSKRCLYYYDAKIDHENDIVYWKNSGYTSGYGGKFVENIVQAIARDCLAVGLMRLRHLKIVSHVHDEIIIEGDYLDEAQRALEKPISWAPGLILRAEGYYSPYYKK
jgi:DNA polymerase bacteriophage-type